MSSCFQIKFEHFSSGFTDAVRRNHNASKRTGHGGCLRGPSHHGNKTQHASHGLRRRRRKTPATANLQQPRVVTRKVRTAAGNGDQMRRGRGVDGQHRVRAAQTQHRATLSGAVAPHYPRFADERPCNEFISQITVFRL